MLIDVLWMVEVSIALIVSSLNVITALMTLWRLWIEGGNGARRLNAIRHLMGEAPIFATLIVFGIFGIDAIYSPAAGKGTKIYFVGVVLLLGIPPIYTVVSGFFFTYRRIFRSQAEEIDTGKHRFPKHLLEKQADLKGLGIWSRSAGGPPLDLHEDFIQVSLSSPNIEFNSLMGYDITKQELLNECLRRNIDILHIASHGENDSILLSDGLIDSVSLSSSILASDAKVVVLSACNTEEIAEFVLFLSNVEAVVYTRTVISDKDAIAFSRPFYKALGKGITVKHAFAMGCSMVPLEVATNTLRLSGSDSFKFKITKRSGM